MSSLKKLFGTYVSNPESLTQMSSTDAPTVSRILVIPTHSGAQEPLVSYALCREVAACSSRGCLVEAIAPLPMLSFASDSLSNDALLRVISDLNARNVRAIIVEGVVQHGNLGNSQRMSFGSMGPLVALAVEAAVLLPRPYSWVNSLASQRVDHDRASTEKLQEEAFYRLVWSHSTQQC